MTKTKNALKKKCIIHCVKVRLSDIPGDFFYSWVANIYRIKSDGIDIKKPDLIVCPNPNRKYPSIVHAFNSAKRYMESVFKIPIIEKDLQCREDIKKVIDKIII